MKFHLICEFKGNEIMEWLILVLVVLLLAAFFGVFKSSETKDDAKTKSKKHSIDSYAINPEVFSRAMEANKKNIKTGVLVNDPIEEKQSPRQEVHHYHHVRVTHDWAEDNRSSEANKDHTEKVWNKLGYEVKPGETYDYKFYGREIFKPHQVQKIGNYRNRIASPGLSENQLKVKTIGLALVEKTGSKRAAKDILVEKYGFDEQTAKYATGYDGYRDY